MSDTRHMATPGDPLLGRQLDGRYRIDAPLGRGGMGVVYRGYQPSMDRPLAIKVLRAELAGDPEVALRFEREARSASKLVHPHIISLFDYGQTEDGLLYIAMELLKGETLRVTLDREGPLAPHRALRVMVQVLDALSAAHHAGVVHRDLKPENVFRLATGLQADFVKLLDFGIAKFFGDPGRSNLTQGGVALGTPAYMAPEQVQGEAVDHRTDLYAAGVLLFEALTGRPPFVEGGAVAVMMGHVSREPPRLAAIRPELVDVREIQAALDRALAKRPEDRFESAAQMMAALPAATDPGGGRGDTSAASPFAAPASMAASSVVPGHLFADTEVAGEAAALPAAVGPQAPRGRAPRRTIGMIAALVVVATVALGVWLALRSPSPVPPSRVSPAATPSGATSAPLARAPQPPAVQPLPPAAAKAAPTRTSRSQPAKRVARRRPRATKRRARPRPRRGAAKARRRAAVRAQPKALSSSTRPPTRVASPPSPAKVPSKKKRLEAFEL